MSVFDSSLLVWECCEINDVAIGAIKLAGVLQRVAALYSIQILRITYDLLQLVSSYTKCHNAP
jgi:hypothetical protein